MKKHKQNGPVAPKGSQYVRIDFGDSSIPMEKRVYVQTAAGYGEGQRATAARNGLPNYRKIISKIRKQLKTGRKAKFVIPPIPRAMAEVFKRTLKENKEQADLAKKGEAQ